jgi:hypothetical protein
VDSSQFRRVVVGCPLPADSWSAAQDRQVGGEPFGVRRQSGKMAANGGEGAGRRDGRNRPEGHQDTAPTPLWLELGDARRPSRIPNPRTPEPRNLGTLSWAASEPKRRRRPRAFPATDPTRSQGASAAALQKVSRQKPAGSGQRAVAGNSKPETRNSRDVGIIGSWRTPLRSEGISSSRCSSSPRRGGTE